MDAEDEAVRRRLDRLDVLEAELLLTMHVTVQLTVCCLAPHPVQAAVQRLRLARRFR